MNEVKEPRVRIRRVTKSALKLLDPFAAKIVYHYKSWIKYATNPLHQPYVNRYFENDTFFLNEESVPS